MEQSSDKELILKYLEIKDEKILESLIKKHLPGVYNFIYALVGSRDEAEDITQLSFVKAWRSLSTFDTSKNFRTWILSIARNNAIDYLRKRKAIPISSFENENEENYLAETMTDDEPLQHEIFENNEKEEHLRKAIETLPLNYRTVIMLRYNEDLTFPEIADMLKQSVNTVKSHYRRGLEVLKKRLSAPN